MNLKKYLLALPLVAATLTGCVASDSPILVLNAAALPTGPDADCSSLDQQLVRSSGRLDLSAGVGYFAFFFIESNLQAVQTDVDGEVVAGAEQNDFVADRIDITYANPVGGPVPGALSQPIHFVLRANSEAGTISVNLLPEPARAALAGVGFAGTQIEARFRVHGTIRSGRTISSNEVTYPITVFESSFAGCAAGTVPLATGVCGSFGGQDGTVPTCGAPPAP